MHQPHAPWIAALGSACALVASACAGPAVSAPSNKDCETRVNDTPARLLECIQEPALFGHLTDLQAISDAYPTLDGHGNRDTGQPGYKASVDYVASLMRRAGYAVSVQRYNWVDYHASPASAFSIEGRTFAVGRDWFVARLSASGKVTAALRPVGQMLADPDAEGRAGCTSADFTGFRPGEIALIQRGGCTLDTKVAHAQAAGAAAVVVFNQPGPPDQASIRGRARQGEAYQANLEGDSRIPVVGAASWAVGEALYRQAMSGRAPIAHIDIQATEDPTAVDYNLIADSPLGDPNHVVVLEGHLDAIYGAGILDNGSGSSTILEVALKMARTPTLNRLRYIWFGGEELGLLGSRYYTRHLTKAERQQIVFDIDADVTATPNYVVLVANPRFAANVADFPRDVPSLSRPGNDLFFEYFRANGLPVENAKFGNDGTDSNAFARVGIPNTGVLTQQDCCKSRFDVAVWGGYLGNYEGPIPSRDGGCVDLPDRYCDNITNINPTVLEFASKAVAYVTFKLANDAAIDKVTR